MKPSPVLRLSTAVGLALLAAACATAPKPAAVAPAPVLHAPVPLAPAPVQPVVPVRERLRHAIELLDQGQRDPARVEVVAALAEQPDNDLGKSLLRQIDSDPRQLFGAQSFAYRIQPGETISLLAERFLGDRTLFYGLARYNGIDKPSDAEVGRTIQIPGTPPKRTAPRRQAPTADARPEAPRPAAPAAPTRNPARAAQLRAQALPLLAKGEVGRAVGLLREALRADPESTLVRRDLERAERIGARVR